MRHNGKRLTLALVLVAQAALAQSPPPLGLLPARLGGWTQGDSRHREPRPEPSGPRVGHGPRRGDEGGALERTRDRALLANLRGARPQTADAGGAATEQTPLFLRATHGRRTK